jgi:phage-related protein
VPDSTYGVAVYGVDVYGTSSSAPIISHITVNLIGPTSVQITWQTDVAADTLVQYGLTSAYGQQSALDPTPVTFHAVTLTALQPQTNYYFSVSSTSALSGQNSTIGGQTFNTPAVPTDFLTNFRVLSSGPQQISVGWDTQSPADSQVTYGLLPTSATQVYDPTPVLSHELAIIGLLPNTPYYLQATSVDTSGFQMVSPQLIATTPLPTGRLFTWIEPNGTAHVFDPTADPTFRVIQGAKGYGTPPTQWIEDRIPEHDGPMVREVLYDAREIEVPLLVQSSDYPTLLQKTRALRQWTNVKNGDGTLQIADPDGSVRQFTCRLKQGLEGQEGQDTSGSTWRKMVLVFRTTGPTPYASWPTSLNFTYVQAAASATWFPIFPLVLGGVGIFAQPTIVNPGDVDAEPIFTIVGPATNPTLTNSTTGAKIALTTALLAGQSITIDTRFRIKAIMRNDGTALFSALSNDSSLWTLVPGVNVLSIVSSGTTTASQVLLQFTPRGL